LRNNTHPIPPKIAHLTHFLSFVPIFCAHQVKRMAEAKGRTSAWGSNFRAAPEVLHGYSAPLAKGAQRSVEERLDMRSASKADKFCK
jgi:hypothetical protein